MYRFATVLKTRLALAAASTTVAMLAACGGGGGGGDPTTAAATSGNNTATAQGSSTGSANGVSQSSGNGKNTVPVTYALTVTTTGSGGVTSLPAGISCASASTCSFDFAADTVVALTPNPATDYIFSGWAGACSGTTACSVTLSSVQAVTANFVPAPTPAPTPTPVTYALSVTKQGSGTIGSTPSGVSCAATATSCSGSFNSGDSVTLTAAASSGYTFSGWGGACAGVAPTCAVTMTAAQNVTANFTVTPPPPPVSYTLSVSKQGSGTVNSAPSGVSCTATATSCSGSFTSGTPVTLTAAASTGSTFAGWGGACAASGTASTCSVTMGSAQAVSANFTLNSYPLTVTNQGSGTVTSTPSGISCSTASCSASYAYGTSVALSAAPASGYTFASWGGACSGTGTCSVTVSSALGVTANYTANAAPAITLIQDTRMLAIPNAGTYPTKGVAQTDPNTKFTVTRVADKTELVGDYLNHASPISAIVYSRYTPSNTTGEFVLVHGDNSTSAWIYRTSDNKMMTALKIKPTVADKSTVRSLGEVNELRWDYSGAHPYRLYFVGRSIPKSQAVGTETPGMTFYYTDINPSTGAQSTPVVIRDFSSAFSNYTGTEIMNDVEGDSSNDSRYWAWQVMDTSIASGTYKPVAIFSYDMQTNTVLGSLQRSCATAKVGCTAINTPATAAPYITRPNMVEFSPSGTRVVVDWERAYSGSNAAEIGLTSDGPKAYLPNFSDPIRIGADATHSGWAWGPNGEEMFVSQNNRNDWIEAVNVATAATANCTLISDNSYTCGTKIYPYANLDGGSWTLGMHFGKVYNKAKKGWVFMNTYDNVNTTWGKNQNLFVEINPYATRASKLVRFGPSYNLHYDYRSEGSGALDFNGDNIWATGNWGFTDGRGDVFRVTLPSGWFSLIK